MHTCMHACIHTPRARTRTDEVDDLVNGEAPAPVVIEAVSQQLQVGVGNVVVVDPQPVT